MNRTTAAWLGVGLYFASSWLLYEACWADESEAPVLPDPAPPEPTNSELLHEIRAIANAVKGRQP